MPDAIPNYRTNKSKYYNFVQLNHNSDISIARSRDGLYHFKIAGTRLDLYKVNKNLKILLHAVIDDLEDRIKEVQSQEKKYTTRLYKKVCNFFRSKHNKMQDVAVIHLNSYLDDIKNFIANNALDIRCNCCSAILDEQNAIIDRWGVGYICNKCESWENTPTIHPAIK